MESGGFSGGHFATLHSPPFTLHCMCMIFKPTPFPDGKRALIATGLLIALDLLLALIALLIPVGTWPFLLLVAVILLWVPIGYVAWRAWACLSLSYQIDRNAVTLSWGPIHQIIPLGAIQELRLGEAVTAMQAGRKEVHGPNGQIDAPARGMADRWPTLERYVAYGTEVGTRRRSDGLRIYSLATQPWPEQLVIMTAVEAYGISPDNSDRFLESLAQHHQLGPTHRVAQERHWPRIVRSPLWQDRILLALLIAGFAGFLLLLGVAMTRFTSLPFALPQWDNLDRRMIFIFPAFGFAVWAIDGIWGLLVYRRHRVAAGLLWAGALVAQAAALIALMSITSS